MKMILRKDDGVTHTHTHSERDTRAHIDTAERAPAGTGYRYRVSRCRVLSRFGDGGGRGEIIRRSGSPTGPDVTRDTSSSRSRHDRSPDDREPRREPGCRLGHTTAHKITGMRTLTPCRTHDEREEARARSMSARRSSARRDLAQPVDEDGVAAHALTLGGFGHIRRYMQTESRAEREHLGRLEPSAAIAIGAYARL